MSKKVRFCRRLRFEGLEQRALLAVTAGTSGTELRVTGDNNANTVDIVQTGAGAFTVTSEEGAEGSFTGVTAIRAELKGSTDILHIKGTNAVGQELTGNVNIKMGLGEDQVVLGFVTALDVNGNVIIETSDGNDQVTVAPATNIGGNLTIETGNQDDGAAVAGEFANPITVGGKLTIRMGEGNDGSFSRIPCTTFTLSLLGINDSPISPSSLTTSCVTGPCDPCAAVASGGVNVGDITVSGDTDIETSDGIDVVYIGGRSNFAKFSANTGHGDDYMQVGNGSEAIEITGPLLLETSIGDDILIVQLRNSSTAPATTIKTSDGEDCVTIRNSIFASLDVNTGLDDDRLTFDGPVTVNGNATLNGSGDNDELFDDIFLTVLGTKTVTGFEFDD